MVAGGRRHRAGTALLLVAAMVAASSFALAQQQEQVLVRGDFEIAFGIYLGIDGDRALHGSNVTYYAGGIPDNATWFANDVSGYCLGWDFGDGFTAVDDAEVEHAFTALGRHTVLLHAYTCESTDGNLSFHHGPLIATVQRTIFTYAFGSESEGWLPDAQVTLPGWFDVHVEGDAETSYSVSGSISSDPESLGSTVPVLDGTTGSTFRVRPLRYLDVDGPSLGNGITGIEIRMNYTEADLTSAPESSLAIWYWNGAAWHNTRTVAPGIIPGTESRPGLEVFAAGVDMENDFAWARVNHTSEYVLAGMRPSSGGGGGGSTPAAPPSPPAAPTPTESPVSPEEAPLQESPPPAPTPPTTPPSAPTAAPQDSWRNPFAGSDIILRDAQGRELGPFDPVYGLVFLTSEKSDDSASWGLRDAAGALTMLQEATTGPAPLASEVAWDSSEQENGVYTLEMQRDGEVVTSRTVVVDNPSYSAETLATTAAVASAVLFITAAGQAILAVAAQGAQEIGATLVEDRMRTRLGGRDWPVKRRFIASLVIGAFALALLSLAFSAEGVRGWSLAPYLAKFSVVAPATVLAFGAAYLLECFINARAGLVVRLRFLLSGAAALMVSTLVFRLPFGYPAYVADRPKDGEEEPPQAWEGLRNLVVVLAPLVLLVPLVLLRPSYYSIMDTAMAILTVEVLVSSLPVAPLPGAGVWRHHKGWSLALMGACFALFLVVNGGQPSGTLLLWIGLGAGMTLAIGQQVLHLRVVGGAPRLVRGVDRVLTWRMPGPIGRATAATGRAFDRLVVKSVGAMAIPVAAFARRLRRPAQTE